MTNPSPVTGELLEELAAKDHAGRAMGSLVRQLEQRQGELLKALKAVANATTGEVNCWCGVWVGVGDQHAKYCIAAQKAVALAESAGRDRPAVETRTMKEIEAQLAEIERHDPGFIDAVKAYYCVPSVPTDPPQAKQQDDGESVTLDCGCQRTKGWRCPVHSHP